MTKLGRKGEEGGGGGLISASLDRGTSCLAGSFIGRRSADIP